MAKNFGWTTDQCDEHNLEMFFDLIVVSHLMDPDDDGEPKVFIDQIL